MIEIVEIDKSEAPWPKERIRHNGTGRVVDLFLCRYPSAGGVYWRYVNAETGVGYALKWSPEEALACAISDLDDEENAKPGGGVR